MFAVYYLSEFVGTNPVIILLAFLIFFAASQFIAKMFKEGNFLVFGFQLHSGSTINLTLGYLTSLLFYSGAVWISYLRGEISFEGLFAIKQLLFPVIGMMLLTLLSSASEDLLTRGYLFWMYLREINL